jgi:hypothetical protein
MTDEEYNKQLSTWLDEIDEIIFAAFLNLSEVTNDALTECRTTLN